MEYILVTLQADEEEHDLKIPSFLPVSEIIAMFKELFSEAGENMSATPKGILLDRNKTLQEQNILHGAKLKLV
jgi:uncharacterized ubiquitin-like protein YukD